MSGAGYCSTGAHADVIHDDGTYPELVQFQLREWSYYVPTMKRILVLGAGGAAANGFTRALRMAGGYHLIGTNCNDYDLELAETDEKILIPSGERGRVRQRASETGRAGRPGSRPERRRGLAAVAAPRPTAGVPAETPCDQGLPGQVEVPLLLARQRSPAGHPADHVPLRPGSDVRQAQAGSGCATSAVRAGLARSATNDPAVGKAWFDHQHGWGRFTAAQVLDGADGDLDGSVSSTATWLSARAAGG